MSDYVMIKWSEEPDPISVCECGRKRYSYACVRYPTERELELDCIPADTEIRCLMHHLACRRCGPDPQGFGIWPHLGPSLEPEWERGQNWYHKVNTKCSTCGERLWQCSPAAEESGIQADISQHLCRVCPLPGPPKPAYVKSVGGVFIPNLDGGGDG